jgi:hypothetical protein
VKDLLAVMNDLAYVDVENDGINDYLLSINEMNKNILEEVKRLKNYIS